MQRNLLTRAGFDVKNGISRNIPDINPPPSGYFCFCKKANIVKCGATEATNFRPPNSNPHMRCIMELTQAYLKTILHYDPETGLFTRLTNISYTKTGDIAGSIKKDGYVVIGVAGKCIKAHRLAWLYVYGRWPIDVVDHINGIPSDNRLSNLRESSRSQNAHNQRMQRSNTSGFKGVVKHYHRFRARIAINGALRHIGTFDTAELAYKAYCSAADALHGEFAKYD